MNHARFLRLAGAFLTLMVFQVQPVSAQQFSGFSKKLDEVELSNTASVTIYQDVKGKKRVGLVRNQTRGRKWTALKVKFSSTTEFSNFTLVGDSLFFIAEDKAWVVKYFWTMDNGALKFAATNAARKKTVFSKRLRKTSIAYPFLIGPTAKSWWLGERKRTGDEITEEDISFYSFNFGAALLDRRTVLVAYRVTSSRIPLGIKNSQGFLYRLRGREVETEKDRTGWASPLRARPEWGWNQ